MARTSFPGMLGPPVATAFANERPDRRAYTITRILPGERGCISRCSNPDLLFSVVIEEFTRRQREATMNTQRDLEERSRRSADHSTRDRSGVEPVHGLRQAAMIGTGVAVKSGARARPGSEQAPVLAPLTVLVGSALLVLAQLYLAISLAPVIGEVLGSGGSAAAAALGTSYALAYAVGFLIFGPLSDRYGRKLILVAGLAVFAVVTAGLAAAASLPVVALLRTVQGLVAASFGPVALAYVAEALPPRWRSTGIGAMSTAFLSAGILGQVYAQAVAETLGWRWVFGLAAPACMIAAVAMAMILIEPLRTGQRVSLPQKYRALGALAIRPELALLNAASFPVILSFVGMYAALGPLLQTQFRLDHTGVLLVRLAGLPALLLAPVAGWLAGRYGATRVAVVGFLIAAAGLAAEAISAAALWALVIASVIFTLGVATIVPAVIALVGSRGGSSRAGALAINGLVVFAGASCGPLAAQLPISFAGLMLSLAALLMIASGLVAISNRQKPKSPV